MLWFFVGNIMLTEMLVKNTSSSSLALSGFHLLFEAELQANHKIVSLWGTHTSWGDATLLLYRFPGYKNSRSCNYN